jgi:hypothetical protein
VLAAVSGSSSARGRVPLVDVQVGRHVGGQAGCWGRSSHGLQAEVVSAGLLHAHVAKVEAVGSQAVGAKERFRGEIAAVAPGAGDGRRAHGGERRRHLHGGGRDSERLRGGRRRLLLHLRAMRRNGTLAAGVQPISIQ